MSDDMLPPRDEPGGADTTLEDELRALFAPVKAPQDFRERLKAELLHDDERLVLLSTGRREGRAQRLVLPPLRAITSHPRAALLATGALAAAVILLVLAFNTNAFGLDASYSSDLKPTPTRPAIVAPPIAPTRAHSHAAAPRPTATATSTITPSPTTITPATDTPIPPTKTSIAPTATPPPATKAPLVSRHAAPAPTITSLPSLPATNTPPPPPPATPTAAAPTNTSTALPSATAMPPPSATPTSAPPSPTARPPATATVTATATPAATATPLSTPTPIIAQASANPPAAPTARRQHRPGQPGPKHNNHPIAIAPARSTRAAPSTATGTPTPPATPTTTPSATATATPVAIVTARPTATTPPTVTATPSINNVVNLNDEKPNARIVGVPAPNESNGILGSPLQGALENSMATWITYTVPMSWTPTQAVQIMPVYPLARMPITETDVLAIAHQLGVRDPFNMAPQADGSIVAPVQLDTIPYSLTVYSGYGAPWFRLQAVAPSPGILSSVRLSAQATAWLQDHNLLRPDLQPGPTQNDGALEYTQSFSDTSLLGAAALSISFDGRGILRDLTDEYIVPHAPTMWPAQPSIIAADEAVLNGQGLYQGPQEPAVTITGPAAVGDLSIAYAGVHGAGADYLEPVYVLSGTVATANGAQPFDVYISALQPQPPDAATPQP